MPIRMKSLVAGCALALMASYATSQELAPLNSDTEKDRIDWSQLEAKFGPAPGGSGRREVWWRVKDTHK